MCFVLECKYSSHATERGKCRRGWERLDCTAFGQALKTLAWPPSKTKKFSELSFWTNYTGPIKNVNHYVMVYIPIYKWTYERFISYSSSWPALGRNQRATPPASKMKSLSALLLLCIAVVQIHSSFTPFEDITEIKLREFTQKWNEGRYIPRGLIPLWNFRESI